VESRGNPGPGKNEEDGMNIKLKILKSILLIIILGLFPSGNPPIIALIPVIMMYGGFYLIIISVMYFGRIKWKPN